MDIADTHPQPVLVTWSGGKDSCMALDALMADPLWDVKGLLTTLTSPFDRVSMHGVRRELLLEQAASLGLPLEGVWLEAGEANEEYERKMERKLWEHLARGTRHVAFGDIYLEDLRRYREASLAKVGMLGVFPLWGRDTKELVRAFTDRGYKAVITCVDTWALDRSFVGNELGNGLLERLPAGVDPCGENGEFHTFVYDGPLFSRCVRFRPGEIVVREAGRFAYQDLLPL